MFKRRKQPKQAVDPPPRTVQQDSEPPEVATACCRQLASYDKNASIVHMIKLELECFIALYT